MGTLKLQLKYALNEKEMCEYKSVEERNKARMPVSAPSLAVLGSVGLARHLPSNKLPRFPIVSP